MSTSHSRHLKHQESKFNLLPEEKLRCQFQRAILEIYLLAQEQLQPGLTAYRPGPGTTVTHISRTSSWKLWSLTLLAAAALIQTQLPKVTNNLLRREVIAPPDAWPTEKRQAWDADNASHPAWRREAGGAPRVMHSTSTWIQPIISMKELDRCFKTPRRNAFP